MCEHEGATPVCLPMEKQDLQEPHGKSQSGAVAPCADKPRMSSSRVFYNIIVQ